MNEKEVKEVAKIVSKKLSKEQMMKMLQDMEATGATSASVEVEVPSAPRNVGEAERLQAWMNRHIDALRSEVAIGEEVEHLAKQYNLNFDRMPSPVHKSVETAKDPEQAYSAWKFSEEKGPMTTEAFVETLFDWIDRRKSFYQKKNTEYAQGQIAQLDALDQALQEAFDYVTEDVATAEPAPAQTEPTKTE